MRVEERRDLLHGVVVGRVTWNESTDFPLPSPVHHAWTKKCAATAATTATSAMRTAATLQAAASTGEAEEKKQAAAKTPARKNSGLFCRGGKAVVVDHMGAKLISTLFFEKKCGGYSVMASSSMARYSILASMYRM